LTPCLLAGWAKAVGLVTTKARLIEGLAGSKNRVGILLQCRFVSTLRSLYQRLDASPKSALPIFFQAPRGQNQISDFGQNFDFGLNGDPFQPGHGCPDTYGMSELDNGSYLGSLPCAGVLSIWRRDPALPFN
jgi:hypothetical protein